MDLQKIFDEGFEAVKAYVDRSFEAYDSRVSILQNHLSDLEGRLLELTQKPEPVSVKSALIDRENKLVLTLSNGDTKELGNVVGDDGKPGADGLGFDDLSVEYDGEKTVTVKFVRGQQSKEFPLVLPVVIDRGVFSEGKTYEPGDGVTWAGSFWIAQEATTDKPDSAKGWRLAVKKGRDGKDGKIEPAAKSGPIRVTIPKGGE
ncbi:hypothetical protein CQZ93_13095 [Ochrobactrum vermis]|nr:hypothetical protein CQZ93_13095 [Ochrobactrum vermis]